MKSKKVSSVSLNHCSQGFFAMVLTDIGEYYTHEKFFESELQAKSFCQKVKDKGSIIFTHWSYTRTLSGSIAYYVNGDKEGQLKCRASYRY